MYEPVIKWSGSKRSQAKEIITYFPKEINTYYEPFCGGCSVLRRLLNSDIKVNKYVCSDLNQDLINLWNVIKSDPKSVYENYEIMWDELNQDNDINRKKNYYNSVRKRYNAEHNPFDFMFIMRTAINGMPRYNASGEFNTSFHITRSGIKPEKLKPIIYEWNKVLNDKDVKFVCCSYENIKPNDNDFVYCDPPYSSSAAMYFGKIDYEKLWDYLRAIPCKYALTFNKSAIVSEKTIIPKDIYSKHISIVSGVSSFNRVVNCRRDMIYENLYLK